MDTRERINKPGNMHIGDEVWVGEDATLLKNAEIGNGSVIGACSVLAGKIPESHVVVAGNPATIVKRNIFWRLSNDPAYIDATDYLATGHPKQ